MVGPTANRPGLSVVTVKVTVWDDSLGPAEMLVAQFGMDWGEASWGVFGGCPWVRGGGSLTGPARGWRVGGAGGPPPPLAVPPLSCRVTATWATPLVLGAGLNVRFPVAASTAGPAVNRPGMLGVSW